MKLFFVTGTDTGVGKTYFTVEIIKYLKKLGKRAIGFKPVETGCSPECEDAKLLSEVSGVELKPVYSFDIPIAPAMASEFEKNYVSHTKIIEAVRKLEGDYIFVEGAGGIMVPLRWDYLFLDLAKDLNAKIIVVSLSKLGVINHTLLTIKVCESAGLEVSLVVLNTPRSFDESSKTNAFALKKLVDIPVIELISEEDLRDIVKVLERA